MKRIFKEPLLHFLLLGAILFIAYGVMQKPGARGDAGEIVVTMGQVENLAATFAKTWQRPPTPEELAGLVRDRVREEVYYREAMAMGLDKDDTIIRRRLRQKMEFISDDIAAQAEPTDAELSAYLEAHADAFRVETRFTFRQVYLDPAKHGENLTRDAEQLLAQLNQAGAQSDVSQLGDTLMLEHQFSAASTREIGTQFGEQFAASLSALVPGQWQGPIKSGYGVHLVMVSDRTEGRLPALADVRDAVRRDWQNARRLEINEKFYQELLTHYTVTIEGLEAAEKNTAANRTQ
ncbi:MAG: peptidylprolyl isomerase [Nitrospirota bacterium]|nr:peptidylprolyl isomerase [Nitrospirota bacterium]MDH5773404.1 peptidylprolyl isomerase [Nitrospirota bacterium]